MKKAINNILLCLVLMLSTTSMANTSYPVIAVEYPPFTSHSPTNPGIAFDLLTHLTASQNITWLPEILPPARAYKRVSEQDWCASFYPIFGENEYSEIQLTKNPIHIGLVRKRIPQPFTWQSLTELSGKTVAVLRAGDKSDFVKRLTDANLQPVFTENIQQAYQLVLKDRVDLAMIDNVTFSNLDAPLNNTLQMSQSFLLSTPVTLFVNHKCIPQEIIETIKYSVEISIE